MQEKRIVFLNSVRCYIISKFDKMYPHVSHVTLNSLIISTYFLREPARGTRTWKN